LNEVVLWIKVLLGQNCL